MVLFLVMLVCVNVIHDDAVDVIHDVPVDVSCLC